MLLYTEKEKCRFEIPSLPKFTFPSCVGHSESGLVEVADVWYQVDYSPNPLTVSPPPPLLSNFLIFEFCFCTSRGTETEDALQRRLGNAKAEMTYGMESGNFEKVS